MLEIFRDVAAVARMDRYAMAAGNKADYTVTRERIAAARKLDKAVVDALDYNALAALDALFGWVSTISGGADALTILLYSSFI